jgi:hypothetical protein
MNEGRDRGLWFHTAAIESTLANTVRDPKKRRKPWKTIDFHPWEENDKREREKKTRRTTDGKVDVSILRAVFVDRRGLSEIEADFGI